MLDFAITEGVTEADLIEPVGKCEECGADCFFSDESFDCIIHGRSGVHRVEGADSDCCGSGIIINK